MKIKTNTSKHYSKAEKQASCILLLIAMVAICAVAAHDVDKIKIANQSRLKAQEYKIKAVYIYNFILFTEWPKQNIDQKNENETLTIGIIGYDPFGDNFAEIEDRIIKSKKKILRIKRLGRYDKKMQLDNCALLFIGSSERNNFEEILQAIEGLPILTVADTKNFLEFGGMINLVKIENRVRFEINRTPVKNANLRLSSQLLRNAVKVIEKPNKTNSHP